MRRTDSPLTISIALALALAAVACDEPNNGPTTVSIRVVQGAILVGEVGTQLPSQIVLEYRDASGEPRRSVPIRVECAGYATGDPPCLEVRAAGDTSSVAFRPQRDFITNSRGRVAIEGRFGGVAGVGWMRFIDAVNGFVDSTNFVAFAGPAVRVGLAPNDTAVRVGQTVSLRGSSYDAFGNRASNAVTWEVIGPAAEVVSPGVIRGLAHGRVKVRISLGAWSDSVMLSVVPAGAIAAVFDPVSADDPDRIAVFQTDGANGIASLVAANCIFHLGWAPAGDQLVYAKNFLPGVCFAPRLFRATLAGVQTKILADTLQLQDESMGRMGVTGDWIYFVGRTGTQNGEIWRVRLGGTDAERIGPAAGFGDTEYLPTVSPDGQQVIYASIRGDTAPVLRSLNTTTRAVTEWLPNGQGPAWSPDGSRVAYIRAAKYRVRNADGSGPEITLVDSPLNMYSPPSWSPDGQWLVVVMAPPDQYVPVTGTLALVNVQSGLALPLGWTYGYRSPGWKPTP